MNLDIIQPGMPKMYYLKQTIVLDSKPKYLPIVGTYLALNLKETNADLSKVRVGLNNPPNIPLSEVAGGFRIAFTQLVLSWDDSETGKQVSFIIGQQQNMFLDRTARDETVYYGNMPIRPLTILNQQIYALGGNMYFAVTDLEVDGTLVVSDSALMRVFNSMTVTGKTIIEDNAQIVLEVIE